MEYKKYYETKDRFEIVTLIAAGCIVDNYEWKRGSVYFHFQDEEHCKMLLKDLISKRLKVYAHEMIGAMQLSSSIFNNKRVG